ncbi:DUF2027 domain-containing protein [uncultured Rikenella sp.]|uniref:Smr/MutS family protein n=1 Tax=uncultured Rikenella sp. TaxID=368003 RepID=UPI00262A4237|nr:DUF2027 domain-containing protein [uncultured Rikenella sp.]
MIKAGSRVKFISDTGVGIVRSIKGNMAYVEVEDGFEIPALISDIVEVEIEEENAAIVKIGPSDPKPSTSHAAGTNDASTKKQRATVRGLNNYGRVSLADDYEDDEPIDLSKFRKSFTAAVAETEVDRTPAVPEKAPWEVTDYLVKLLFVPVADTDKAAENADLEAWLVNDSSYTLFYNIARREQRGGGLCVRTIDSGTIEADSKQKIKLYRRAELAEISTLHISLLPYKPTAFVPRAVEAFDLELHPLRFVRASSFVENDYFETPAVEFILASSDELADTSAPVIPASAPKPKANPAQQKQSTKDEEVVDLHAEAILDSTAGMAAGEILQAQLARFTVALDGAVKGGVSSPKRMVFIHGVGKGKLRYEIEKELKRSYPKLRYQDASFAEYGYGALIVFLK